MHILKTHSSRILIQDLLLKNIYKKEKAFPKFEKITLSSKFNHDHKGGLIIMLEVLTYLRPCLTQSKKNSLVLNLRKGELVGCKLVLRKKHIYNFLETFIFEVLPSFKKFEAFKCNGQILSYNIKDLFNYDNLTVNYNYLQSITSLDLTVQTSKKNINFFYGTRLPQKK